MTGTLVKAMPKRCLRGSFLGPCKGSRRDRPWGEEIEVGGPSVNPVRRKQPSDIIPTGIAGIDLNNTLVTGQKIPFFADPDQPFNQVMAMVAMRAKAGAGGNAVFIDDAQVAKAHVLFIVVACK